MGRVRLFLGRFEEILAGVLLVAMCLATFAGVVFRYALNSPIPWTEEFSRYSFIWLVFIGAAACTKQKKHIVIETLIAFVPRSVRVHMLLVADALVLLLMGMMAYYGWILMASAVHPTSTLKIPQYVVYAVVPTSAVLVFLHTLGDIRRNLGEAFPGNLGR